MINQQEKSPEAILNSAVDALKILRSQECSLDEYLDDHAQDPLLRRRLSNLLFTLFRRRNALVNALRKHCRRDPEKSLHDLLLAALTMAVFQKSLPPESVVNISVDLAKKRFSRNAGNFVNAVLRKAISSVDVNCDPLPENIRRQWQKNFPGAEYSRLTELFTRIPPITVRQRGNKPLPQELMQTAELQRLYLDLPWDFYECGKLSVLLKSAEFQAGAFYIQDPAPGKVVNLLKKYHALLPENICFADLCAAPGGKFIMGHELLTVSGHHITRAVAVDRSPRRLELVKRNLARCGISGELLAADAADWQLCAGEVFDLVTCDVPCSNTGVFRRRPDALWRWSTDSLKLVTLLQRNILDNAVRLTARSGLLLYSTCSLETEENQQQVNDFLFRHPDFELLESELFGPDELCDGTFAALLRRKPEQSL